MKFTNEEFLELYNQKKNDVKIAKILGVSTSAVCQRRHVLNLPCYQKPCIEIPKDLHRWRLKYKSNRQKLANHYNVSTSVITRWLTEDNRCMLMGGE